MKKTSAINLESTLPAILWESSGVRYPFVSGYKLTRVRGELVQVDAHSRLLEEKALHFVRMGWRLKWKNPTCELIPSLYRLSSHCLANSYVRIWLRQGQKRLYRGYVVQVAWPIDWQEQYWPNTKEFSLSFWA